MKIGAFVGSVCLALCASAIAREALTNDSIEKMATAQKRRARVPHYDGRRFPCVGRLVA